MKLFPVGLALVSSLAGAALATGSFRQQAFEAGPEHAVLDHLVGEWDATASMMGLESKGAMTCKRAMNGLWLLQDYAGEMMGQDFVGHGIVGYDPTKKKYVSVWVDSMTPSLDPAEGAWNAEQRELTFHSEGPDPMSGETVPYKQVTRFSEDGQRMEWRMYLPGPDGSEHEAFAIDYVRKE